MTATISYAANIVVRAHLARVSKRLSDRFEYFERSLSKKSENWNRVLLFFDHSCVYCGKRLDKEKLQVEHLYPINKTDCGLHIINNVAPCCSICNNTKHNSKDCFFKLNETKDTLHIREDMLSKLKLHLGDYIEFREKENERLRKDCEHLYSSICSTYNSL